MTSRRGDCLVSNPALRPVRLCKTAPSIVGERRSAVENELEAVHAKASCALGLDGTFDLRAATSLRLKTGRLRNHGGACVGGLWLSMVRLGML